MKHITIKSITMINFRGFTDKTIEFSDNTSIKGMNGTGKSTVFTAFMYLLFDKDQFGRKDFEIKPLEATGEAKHQIDSVVSAELMVDKQPISLKKIYREKWQKQRGTAEVVFNGHETEYIFNQVPCTMREYNSKIELLCPESLFRLLTNPLFFPMLPWMEQRNTLFQIVEVISDTEIAAKDKAWKELFETINGSKTLDEYKKEIAASKRKIKESLDTIPARIDEVTKSIPETEDWKVIEDAISEKTAQTQGIDKQISDISSLIESESREYRNKQESINKKKSELQAIEFEYKKKLSSAANDISFKITEANGKLQNLKAEKERTERAILNLTNEKDIAVSTRNNLREEWTKINSATQVTFSEGQFICPTCKRELEESDIESQKSELTARHNEHRASALAENTRKGKDVSLRIEQLTATIQNGNQRMSDIDTEVSVIDIQITALKADLAKSETSENAWKEASEADVNYIRIKREITILEEAVGTEPKRINITEQTEQKALIQKDLRELIEKLSKRDIIARAEKRIAELKNDQKSLAQELSNLEKIEFNITSFTRAKIDIVEQAINAKFSKVSWKLFEKQVNGSEVEVCTLTVGGIPFAELNNACKYQAGLDVIKTLSEHYQISAPIIIDNREGISEIPQTNSQVISLYVDPAYPILTIN